MHQHPAFAMCLLTCPSCWLPLCPACAQTLPRGSRGFPRPVASCEQAAPISTTLEGPGSLEQEYLQGSMDTRVPQYGGTVVPEENGMFLNFKLNRGLQPKVMSVIQSVKINQKIQQLEHNHMAGGGGRGAAVEQKE